MDKTGFAAAVKAVRGRKSQAAFARLLGVAQVTISEWETGKKIPGRDNLLKLVEVTGKPISFFVGALRAKAK